MIDQNYKLLQNYRNDTNLVEKYHEFISKIFPSISFREWYEKGFWAKNYIPYSLIKDNVIISNVSVSIMNVFVDGQEKIAAQIGAVGTLLEYRHQGLSRHLMNYIIDKLKDKVHFFFLFANDTVMDFYPKFGFRNIKESNFILEKNIPKINYSARKLNIRNNADYSLLQNLIKKRKPITKTFGAEKYDFVTMWHVLNIYSNDIFYLEEEEIIFIKTEKDGILEIWEVIFKEKFDFQEVLYKIITSESINKIIFHFPPDQLEYEYNKIISEQSGLFVRGEIFKNHSKMKFPETAHT
jgi:GNAT superfamily N-acetyltransferase